MGLCKINPLYENSKRYKWVLRTTNLVKMYSNNTPPPFISKIIGTPTHGQAFHVFDDTYDTWLVKEFQSGSFGAELSFEKEVKLKKVYFSMQGTTLANWPFEMFGVRKDGVSVLIYSGDEKVITIEVNDSQPFVGIRVVTTGRKDIKVGLTTLNVIEWYEKTVKFVSLYFPKHISGYYGYARNTAFPNDTFVGFYMDLTPRAFSPSSDNEIFRFTTSGNFNYQFIYRNLTPGDSRQWVGWLTSGAHVTATLLTLTANRNCRILFQYTQGVWTICVDGTNRVLIGGNAGAVASLNGHLKIGGCISANPMSFDLNNLRFFKTTLTEAQMLEITKGDVDKYLNKSNCPIIYNNFDSSVVIKNKGTTMNADLNAVGCYGWKKSSNLEGETNGKINLSNEEH